MKNEKDLLNGVNEVPETKEVPKALEVPKTVEMSYKKDRPEEEVKQEKKQAEINNLKKQKQEEKEYKEKRKRRNRRIRIFLISIGIILLLLLLLKSCGSDRIQLPDDVEKVVDAIFDNSQKDKEKVVTETPEERQERINKEAMKGMLTIDLNVTPIFENGISEGNFQFLNDKENYYLMQVEVYRDDTNELIYKSKLIKQGNIIERAKLDVPLKKGVYDCTAFFRAVDPETFAIKGTVGAKMKITILD